MRIPLKINAFRDLTTPICKWMAGRVSTGLIAICSLLAPACWAQIVDSSDESWKVVVPASQIWSQTDTVLQKDDWFTVEASGGIEGDVELVKEAGTKTVKALGTYLFDGESQPYPLELERPLDDRMYPGYCMMGKIGEEGTPFYIGMKFSGQAPEAGDLWLGINDPNPLNNEGAFRCRIEVGAPIAEGSLATAEESPQTRGPIQDANVVIFFIDGLRPDVAVEMARWGHMPNFNQLFMENGVWMRNSFSVLPSLTQTNYASMITGLYSNRHGVKMQSYWDREDKKYIFGLKPPGYTRVFSAFSDRHVKALPDYFSDSFASTVTPFGDFAPEVLEQNMTEWQHRAVNTSLLVSEVREQIDEANTRFALDLVSSPKVRVMMIYLPRNDTVSEHTPHGQFGGARNTLAKLDQRLGEIIDRFKARERFDKTYFILVSDHGHSGGDGFVNQRYDVEKEIFGPHLEMNVQAAWHKRKFPGVPGRRLGIISDGDGAIGIYLPHGHVDSRNLRVPNSYADMANYGLADGRTVNAVKLFTEYTAMGPWKESADVKRPVDFAVVKVDASTVFLYKSSESQALIHTLRTRDGNLSFKYSPVRDFEPGRKHASISHGDPLGYLDDPSFEERVGDATVWLARYHTGREWLAATCETEYPGCVDALSMYFRWDPAHSSDAYTPPQPDLLLFANRGWAFEPEVVFDDRAPYYRSIGSRHGMAFRDASNNSMFLSGPGIKKGEIINTPCRMVDVLPTVLQFMNIETPPGSLDGYPIRDIWEAEP